MRYLRAQALIGFGGCLPCRAQKTAQKGEKRGIMEDQKYMLDLIQSMADRTIRRLWIALLALAAVDAALVGACIWLWTH